MAGTTLRFDAEAFNRLEEAMKGYQGNVENKINEVLWNEGGVMIEEAIMQLLPFSGRNWKGKKPAAKSSKPFVQGKGNLSVTVKTKKDYGYLYFPDDGSNTRKHAGNQQFMLGGAENEQEEIIQRCIAKLINIE